VGNGPGKKENLRGKCDRKKKRLGSRGRGRKCPKGEKIRDQEFMQLKKFSKNYYVGKLSERDREKTVTKRSSKQHGQTY